MGRALLVLHGDAERAKAAHWIAKAKPLTRVEFRGPKRTLPQNDAMWSWLTAISEQLTWHGQRYIPDDWKDYMMHQLRKARWMPDEDGGMLPIGMHSSDLSREEMSDLLEIIRAFAARHGVVLMERDAPSEPAADASPACGAAKEGASMGTEAPPPPEPARRAAA